MGSGGSCQNLLPKSRRVRVRRQRKGRTLDSAGRRVCRAQIQKLSSLSIPVPRSLFRCTRPITPLSCSITSVPFRCRTRSRRQSCRLFFWRRSHIRRSPLAHPARMGARQETKTIRPLSAKRAADRVQQGPSFLPAEGGKSSSTCGDCRLRDNGEHTAGSPGLTIDR